MIKVKISGPREKISRRSVAAIEYSSFSVIKRTPKSAKHDETKYLAVLPYPTDKNATWPSREPQQKQMTKQPTSIKEPTCCFPLVEQMQPAKGIASGLKKTGRVKC